MRNLVLVILGMAAYYLLGKSPDWNIVGMIGIIVASAGMYYLTLPVYPFKGNFTDWLFPLIYILIVGYLLVTLRSGSLMNIDTLAYAISEGLFTLATFTGVVRLYSYARSKIGLLAD